MTADFQNRASVASDGADGFVVVWESDVSSGDDLGRSVQARLFSAEGVPIGPEFQVNTYTTSTQSRADVSIDNAGGFVVVWASTGSPGTDTDGRSIQGQRFASDGTPVGGQFQVNTYTTSLQNTPAVSPDNAGGFVVVWISPGSDGTDGSGYSIQGQRYAGNGSPLGTQFQVNTYVTALQNEADVSRDGSDGFVVVWRSFGSNGTDQSNSSVQAQRYAMDGSVVGGEFQVNTYTFDYQKLPSIAPDSAGGFVVVWDSDGSDGTDLDQESIHGQRFAANGTLLGPEFQVNTYTQSYQIGASVAQDASGGFVVAWRSDGSDGTDTDAPSIQARRYAADGSPAGPQFQVNTHTTDYQGRAVVHSDGVSDFIVVWESVGSSGTDSSARSVVGQRFVSPLFEDGFETGDTTAWF